MEFDNLKSMKKDPSVSVFDFDDLSLYLNTILASADFGRGSRTALAEALGVQGAFVSLVTKKKAQLSLEQALKAAAFLRLAEDEKRYWMTLVQFERAGTAELKSFLKGELQRQLAQRKKIRNRIGVKTGVSLEDQTIYYSHANYGILHVLAALPEYRREKRMGEVLGLDSVQLKPYLQFLVSRGLIDRAEREGEYRIGKTRLHLSEGAPALSQHHANLRNFAIGRLGHIPARHLHYSAVFGLTRKDYDRVRELILQLIEKSEDVLKSSRPEIPAVMNLDWFDL